MKKLQLITAAIASIVLASCSNDDLTRGNLENPTRPIEINFGSQFTAITRADFTGEAAATKLGNQFVVTGYKGGQSAYSTTSSTVFDNYLVEWTENSANTTESNSTNWEYVGKGPYVITSVNSQTTKYWDYSQNQYDFIAYSLGGKTAITSAYDATNDAGKIQVTAIDPANMKTAAYTLTGSANDLASCYIADIVTVGKNDYGNNPVTIRFRNLNTKVRIGLYENIPGYSVKDVKFYTNGTATAAATDGKAYLYTSNGNPISLQTANEIGTMTVFYPTVDTPASADNNKAHISYSSSDENAKSYASFGAFGNGEIGTYSAAATYAGDSYAVVLPDESGNNLNLRVDFTMVSEDGSDEEIKVSSASAEIPAAYSAWLAGYAYTYIFKITKDFNGTTGTGEPGTPGNPAGLYPITFDAAVIQDEIGGSGYQETITTVATPSITTYTEGQVVTTNDEYLKNKDIFVTVEQNNNLLALNGNSFLYTIPAGKTEAEVLAALMYQEDDATAGTIKGRNDVVLTETNLLSFTNQIVNGANGAPINVGDNKAAKFKPTVAGTYAFVYKIADGTQTAKYEPVTFAAGADVKDATNTNERFYCDYQYENKEGTDAIDGETYYVHDANNDTYTEPATAPTFFYGQNAYNMSLYYKSGESYYLAGDKVATGTTYYIRGGAGTELDPYTYAEITSIAYENFTTAGLYTYDGIDDYTPVAANTEPGDNTVYYQKVGDEYKRCVIMPEQLPEIYIRKNAYMQLCPAGEKAVAGKKYYDRYWWYDGAEYAVKVIKVQ